MDPYPGQPVMVFADPRHANGADEAPAVVTRVWTDAMVSVRIFHDGPCSKRCADRATVLLYPSRDDAEAAPRDPGLRPSGAWPLPHDEPPAEVTIAGLTTDVPARVSRRRLLSWR